MSVNMKRNIVVTEDIDLLIDSFDHTNFKDKNVLITGGTGLFSTYLILYFHELNSKFKYNIGLHVNVRSATKFYKRTGLSQDDVYLIEKNVEELNIADIKTEKLEFVFHLASSSSPSAIKSSPTSIIKANVQGTFSTIEVAKKFGSKIIFSSTREVYGQVNSEILSIKETDVGSLDAIDVRSCYPESKRLAENIIVSSAFEFGLEYAICRIAHVYGPGMAISNDGRIMSDLIGDVVNRRSITLLSDGSALRAFCYITDAVKALLMISTSTDYNVYNIANEEEEVSILDLSYMLVNQFPDRNLGVNFQEPKDSIGYVKFDRVTLNTQRLESIGWRPVINLEAGLSRTVEFFTIK